MNNDCEVCSGNSSKKIKLKEEKGLKQHGFYSHVVLDDPQSPTGYNYHTHGLTKTLNHPDIQIVVPIPPEVAHNIVHNTVKFIKGGTSIEIGKRYEKIVEDLRVSFIYAMESNRDVLRMIIPDGNGVLDEDNISEPFSEQYQKTGIILN